MHAHLRILKEDKTTSIYPCLNQKGGRRGSASLRRPQNAALQTLQRSKTATERAASAEAESYQGKISARDKASKQGTVFSLFEASCHHH